MGAATGERHTEAIRPAVRTAMPFVRTTSLIVLSCFGIDPLAAHNKQRDRLEIVEVEVVGLEDSIEQNVRGHLSIAKLGKDERAEEPNPEARSPRTA